MPEPSNLRLDLPLLLPDVEDTDDRCVARLLESLRGRPGIAEAHVVGIDVGSPELCVHFDPAVITLSRVRELVHSVGADLTSRFAHLSIQFDAPVHARAARAMAGSLRRIPGVLEADVAMSGSARIEFDRSSVTEEKLLESTARLSDRNHVTAKPTPPRSDADHDHKDHPTSSTQSNATDAPGTHDHAHGGSFGGRSELVFVALAGIFLTAGWISGRLSVAPAWLPTAGYVVAYFFGGYFTTKEAIENLRARQFEIDTLMLVAAIGAAALGKWGEGALLLFLFSLGHSLEQYAMGRARRAIEALAELAPETANVRRDGQIEVVNLNALQIADIVIVKPNERLPADGVVVLGTTSVNQAPVTGESVPVDKSPIKDSNSAIAAFDRVSPEHRVFAGTINGSGAIEVMVARRSEQSTMARVVKMVTEAEAQRSPTQQFTERFERIFVPAILALVGLLMFAWVVVDEPFADSFYRAMAVLVAASPCALAISVPSAVLSGIARAGRGGVLVKGGGPLENLGTLTSIAFDKTGTITEGKPKLTDVVTAEGVTEEELLSVATSVEELSDHPLASAIVAGARERLGNRITALKASEVKSITGRGVRAFVDGESVHIGKQSLYEEMADIKPSSSVDAANKKLVATGRTTMIVHKGTRYLGVLGVMDTPRPVAARVMAELRLLGIERLIMISGDNQLVADVVAKHVGLTEARGDLMPEQKVAAIKELRKAHGKVAMVGDGVNDAPAMAHSTVGIAMGAAGSDVALETADVALMADDLSQLPFAVGLSRSTSRIIRQNLWVSLGVVAVLIPATILGLNIGTAVLFHEGSTLLVVANALRLLAYKGKTVLTGNLQPENPIVTPE